MPCARSKAARPRRRCAASVGGLLGRGKPDWGDRYRPMMIVYFFLAELAAVILGWISMHVQRRYVRWIVICVAASVAVYFFWLAMQSPLYSDGQANRK